MGGKPKLYFEAKEHKNLQNRNASLLPISKEEVKKIPRALGTKKLTGIMPPNLVKLAANYLEGWMDLFHNQVAIVLLS